MPRIEQIQQMLAAEPDDLFLSFALAMEYVKQGMQEEAVAQFARVSDLDPNHTAAHSQRADVLFALGRKDQARAALADGVAAAERAGDKHAADKMRQAISLME